MQNKWWVVIIAKYGEQWEPWTHSEFKDDVEVYELFYQMANFYPFNLLIKSNLKSF